LLVGFVASAIAAYIVGIVGTTSLPISGITISAIIAFASILLLLVNKSIDFHLNTAAALDAGGLVIIFAAVVCVAGSVSGDNMQDLKAGQIVGATPWKQQLMLVVGTIASALVIPVILQTTLEAYGIGDILPRAGMDPAHALPAPQATLMATVAKGFFAGNLPWSMLHIGAGLAVLAILVDVFLKRLGSSVRFPVLLFALGIYFPLGYMMAFLVGGLISYAVEKKLHDAPRTDTDSGLLFASGAIAGEAILGAILTLPFAYYQSTEIFALDIAWLKPYETVIGIILYMILGIWLYKQGIKKKSAVKGK
jgi:putative OPT family oligopeptide transporter